MSKLRVIIADLDVNYVLPLESRFIEEYTYNIDLEIITDQNYFRELFLSPQKADVLVVSEKLFDAGLLKHGLEHIYVLTEKMAGDDTTDLEVNRIFKYTSVKEIFDRIASDCLRNMGSMLDESKETRVIAVCSGKGGLGKTTIAMGIAGYLAQNYKKVFYLNAAELQNFHAYMECAAPITDAQVYVKLANKDESAYHKLKEFINKEQFFYLPPFRASLFSLGLDFSIFKNLVMSARESLEYDYIIVDIDGGLNDDMMSLIAIADKVMVVTAQDRASMIATERFAESIGEVKSEKYLFVCNNFDNRKRNELARNGEALNFSAGAYISHVEGHDRMVATDFAAIDGIDKVVYHMI